MTSGDINFVGQSAEHGWFNFDKAIVYSFIILSVVQVYSYKAIVYNLKCIFDYLL